MFLSTALLPNEAAGTGDTGLDCCIFYISLNRKISPSLSPCFVGFGLGFFESFCLVGYVLFFCFASFCFGGFVSFCLVLVLLFLC